MASRYTLPQLAAALGITPSRVRAMVAAGRVTTRRDSLTGRRYVTEAELQRLQATPRKPGRPWAAK